ncbi:MAG TPA: DUF2232 domain-containing protein [Desulfomonilia bacterium]
MPPALTGNKTPAPWLSAGVLLISGTSLICMPEYTMAIVLFLPALYCIFASRTDGVLKYAVSLSPICLGLIPAFIEGAITYGIIILCGLLMWEMIKRKKIGMSVVLPTIAASLIFISMIALLSYKSGSTINQTVSAWVKAMMDNFIRQYSTVLNPADITAFNLKRPSIEEAIIRLFPSITVIGTAMIMWFNLVIASKVALKTDLSRWSCPGWLIAVFIVASVCSLLPNKIVNTIGLNILLIVCIGYFFQGLSVIVFIFEYMKIWTGWRIFFYLLIITQMYIMIMAILLGLFDNWFYFRKRIKIKGDQA